MSTLAKRIIAAVIIVLIIALLVVAKYFSGRVTRIPENPADTIGNTAGNLYNGGTFCELDGTVYFANAYDGGSLYAMSVNQADVRKLSSGGVSYINAAGGYIYYFSATASSQSGLGYVRNGRGIYRVDSSGKNNVLLSRLTTDGMLLLGNTLYFTNFQEDAQTEDAAIVSLDGMSTDGSAHTQLALAHPKLGCAVRGAIYYGGTGSDHFLYELDPASGQESRVAELDLYLPVIQGSTVYYLDLSDDYHLKAYSLSDGSVRVIAQERIDSYNIYGDMIYYQTVDSSGGDGYALKRVRVDGSEMEVVRMGAHTDIQVTSTYVYFREFGNTVPIYCTPTYGAVNVQNFVNAMDAALEEINE